MSFLKALRSLDSSLDAAALKENSNGNTPKFSRENNSTDTLANLYNFKWFAVPLRPSHGPPSIKICSR